MVKVSVIIPVYNASPYLQECLESVMRQTLVEVEIICVDDESTDDSCQQIYAIRKKDSRVLLYQQRHRGAGAARNFGMMRTRGEYITFLDADDYYYNANALETMYNAVKEYDSVIGAAFKKILSHGRVLDDPCFHEFPCSDNIPRWVAFEQWQDDFYFHSYIYKQSFLKQKSIQFPLYLRYQDPPFMLNVMAHAGKFLLIPTILYCQRCREHRLVLDEPQVYDLLCGIYDNMKTSKKLGYEILYRKQLSRINERYYQDIMSNLSSNVIGILATIEKFHQEIFVHEHIRPLQDMRQYVIQQKYNEFLFPFHLLRHNDRFVIYGAGVMGHALYGQWCYYGANFGTLVAIVDRNAKQLTDQEFQVLPPCRLKCLEFDIVLIAIKDPFMSKEAQQYLMELGIPVNKLILCGKCCIAKTRNNHILAQYYR